MGVGFTASLGVYLAHWAGVHLGDGDLASLMAGLLASGSVFLAFAVLGKRSKPVVRPVPRTR